MGAHAPIKLTCLGSKSHSLANSNWWPLFCDPAPTLDGRPPGSSIIGRLRHDAGSKFLQNFFIFMNQLLTRNPHGLLERPSNLRGLPETVAKTLQARLQ